MTEAAALFTRILGTQTAATAEERMMVELLYANHSVTHSLPLLQLGDQRLHRICALTWNTGQCANIFSLLEKSLNPEKYPWHTLHKAVLLLHTITLYGSEVAIDGCIQLFRSIDKLQDYNSALVKQGGFFAVGGTDYGAPVRDAAKELCAILINDDNIRRVRQEAQGTGAESLVPMGEDFLATFTASQGKSNAENAGFGQGRESSSTSLGAGFDLSQVPGMYDNRPDRYFDDKNDVRAATTVGDHQFTREALNTESLLDLVFEPSEEQASVTHLPESTDYLPALARQKELEAQLAQQQEQLQRLQMLAQQQQLLQQQQQSFPPTQALAGGVSMSQQQQQPLQYSQQQQQQQQQSIQAHSGGMNMAQQPLQQMQNMSTNVFNDFSHMGQYQVPPTQQHIHQQYQQQQQQQQQQHQFPHNQQFQQRNQQQQHQPQPQFHQYQSSGTE